MTRRADTSWPRAFSSLGAVHRDKLWEALAVRAHYITIE